MIANEEHGGAFLPDFDLRPRNWRKSQLGKRWRDYYSTKYYHTPAQLLADLAPTVEEEAEIPRLAPIYKNQARLDYYVRDLDYEAWSEEIERRDEEMRELTIEQQCGRL